jgi:hypothetical protein
MGNLIGEIFNGLRTLGSITTKVGGVVKEAVTNPSIVADALSKADTYSERAGQSLKEKAPVTAEALQAILGLEVKSITTNPTAVKEVINGGGNLAGATANRAKIIANSAEFKIQQQTIQAEAERLAEQVKLLAELGGSTNTEVRLTNIKDNPIDKAVTKVETGLLTDTKPTGLIEKINTTGAGVTKAPAKIVAKFFKEEIAQLNYGKAKAIVNGFISDTRQLPAGAFKNEALEILEKNDIQKDRLMGNNATPQKIESLGNSLSDVLVRYEDSLQGKSPTSVKPSLEILEKNDIQKDRLMGNNATPQKIESLGNSLSDVLIGYEASLQGKSSTSVNPSAEFRNLENSLPTNDVAEGSPISLDILLDELGITPPTEAETNVFKSIEVTNSKELPTSTPTQLLKQLQNSERTEKTKAAQGLISIVQGLIDSNDPFVKDKKEFIENAIIATQNALDNRNTTTLLNSAGGLFEIAEGAKRLKIQTDLAPLRKQFQKAFTQDDFQTAKKLNAQIQDLEAQL